VAGVLVRRDHETGYPFTRRRTSRSPASWAQRTVGFSLTDGAEGQQLLYNNLGVMVRGETDRLRDRLWRFHLRQPTTSARTSSGVSTTSRAGATSSLLKALRFFLGRYNITAQTIKSCMDTMKMFLRDLQALEQILGFKVDFKGSWNSAEEIRLGHLPPRSGAVLEAILYRGELPRSEVSRVVGTGDSSMQRRLEQQADGKDGLSADWETMQWPMKSSSWNPRTSFAAATRPSPRTI
jgi:hypothetical protein